MITAIERLLTLRVRDIMSRGIVTVQNDQTLGQASAKLTEAGLSAAPVVDEAKQCVGMLTATDFLRSWAAHETCAASRGNGAKQTAVPRESEQHDHDAALVETRMERALHIASPDETILQAARKMCNEHVHRLPVLNARGEVIAVVSSLDLVAALVSAIEECCS